MRCSPDRQQGGHPFQGIGASYGHHETKNLWQKRPIGTARAAPHVVKARVGHRVFFGAQDATSREVDEVSKMTVSVKGTSSQANQAK